MKKTLFIVSCLLSLVSCFLLFIFLSWHLELGLTRYVDVDEFAHLSWAYQMFSGRRPYIDFLFFFPPGFHVFLMPLFALGTGAGPIIAARVFAFIVFAALVGVTMLLFWLVRRSWVAILAGVILAFLPMPFDKFLEVRPDTLAVLFAMTGMVFQVFGMQDLASKGLTFLRKKVKPYQFFAGIFYALSLLILPKTLPQVGVAVGLMGIRFMINRNDKHALHELNNLLIGVSIPLFLFALWTLTLGNIDQVWYSLTKLPIEANKISQTFIMMPDLFFYPNATFYGSAGWNTGLLVNHAIWIIALFVGIYRLVAPFLVEKSQIPNSKFQTISNVQKEKNPKQFRIWKFLHLEFIWNLVLGAWNLDNRSNVWTELLIAVTFFISVIFYVQIVPLKHTQYLIPIAVFIAFYAADAVDMLWRASQKKMITIILFIIFITVILVGLYRVFVSVNSPKRAWTNAETVKQLTALYQTIPKDEYILDLTGETLYYKHPYRVCCTPFGQSAPYLTRPLPALTSALETTKTKYIFQGGVKRVSTLLPVDQAYIAAHFLPSPTIGGLLVRK